MGVTYQGKDKEAIRGGMRHALNPQACPWPFSSHQARPSGSAAHRTLPSRSLWVTNLMSILRHSDFCIHVCFFHGEGALSEELCFSMAGDGWVFIQELKMAGICLIPGLNTVGLQALPLPNGLDFPPDLVPARDQVYACFLRTDSVKHVASGTWWQAAEALALSPNTSGTRLSHGGLQVWGIRQN